MSSNSNTNPVNPQEPDPAGKPIHIAERFRIAKRNALAWSAVCALIATASEAENPGVEVTTVFKGMKHSQELLVSLALITLVFMVLGYFRAWREVRVNNSEAVYGQEIADVATKVSDYGASLSLQTTKLNAVAEAAETLRAKVIPESKEVAEGLRATISEVATLARNKGKYQAELSMRETQYDWMADAEKLSAKNDGEEQPRPSEKLNSLQRRISELRRQVESEKVEMAEKLDLIDGDIKNGFSPDRITREMKRLPQAEPIDPDVVKLAENLNTLARSIGNADRNWVIWHDHVPVGVSAFLAAVLSLLHLSLPDWSDGILSALGLAVS